MVSTLERLVTGQLMHRDERVQWSGQTKLEVKVKGGANKNQGSPNILIGGITILAMIRILKRNSENVSGLYRYRYRYRYRLTIEGQLDQSLVTKWIYQSGGMTSVRTARNR